MEGSSQAKAGKALEVQFEMDTDSKSVPSPMKQIRCTNCAASMEQNQSKCEYCGTNYKVKTFHTDPSSYDEVLRNEQGSYIVKIPNTGSVYAFIVSFAKSVGYIKFTLSYGNELLTGEYPLETLRGKMLEFKQYIS